MLNYASLRQANANPPKLDPAVVKALDGSIKKNTAFIRKLKTALTAEQLPALLKELLSLKLEKYLSELVSSIVEAKFAKTADAWAAVEICSILHQRFPEFTPQLLDAITKQLVFTPTSMAAMAASFSSEPKEKEEAARISRQRSMIRLLTELYLVGIAKDTPKEGVISGIIKNMLNFDKDFSNMPIAVTFVKSYAVFFLGYIPANGDGHDNEMDPKVGTEPLVPLSIQNSVKQSCTEYFNQASKFLIKLIKHIQKTESNNYEHAISRGEISEDRKEKLERAIKLSEKLTSNLEILSKYINLPMPELPQTESAIKQEMGINYGGREREEKELSTDGVWEDEETRLFYERLIDLRDMVPPILLGEKVDNSIAVQSSFMTEDMPSQLESSVEKLKIAMDSLTINSKETGSRTNASSTDDENAADENTIQMDDEETGEDKIKESTIGSSRAELDLLLTRIPMAMSRDSVDELAVQFGFLNSKSARKRLIKVLSGVPRQRLDLLPYYCRLIATLNPYMPDIAAAVIETLGKEFHGQQKKGGKAFLDDKIKTVRYIGELTKFRLAPLHVVFHVLKVLLEDFSHHNIEVISNLLETCGRFLFKTPETSPRMTAMLEIMMRKKTVGNMDSRHILLIDNAFYYCNPPEKPAFSAKERTPLEQYIRKLMYTDLKKSTVEIVLKQLRKMNWKDSSVVFLISKPFIKPWKVKFANIPLLAYLVSELTRFYVEFGISVVDACMENIRIGLETNIFKHNQLRISTIRFLGELYNYRMVDSEVIFETLYFLLRFGYDTPFPVEGNSNPFDAPHDFFRVRLCCSLLDVCGPCFDRGNMAYKLTEFLAYMQVYTHSKSIRIPMEIDFLITETMELLRPTMMIASDFTEAMELFHEIVSQRPGADISANRNNASDVDSRGGPHESDGIHRIDEAWGESDDDDEEGSRRGHERVGEDEEDEEDYDGVQSSNRIHVGEDGGEVKEGEDEDDMDELNQDQEVGVEKKSNKEEEEEMMVRVHQEAMVNEQAVAEFEDEFNKMMQESLESRKNEKKPAAFDVAIPSLKVRAVGSGNIEGNQESSSPAISTGNEQGVVFNLMMKKGNKLQMKPMALPKDSSFVLNSKLKKEAEKEEKMQLKRLVLSYEERDRNEEDHLEVKGGRAGNAKKSSVLIQMGLPKTK